MGGAHTVLAAAPAVATSAVLAPVSTEVQTEVDAADVVNLRNAAQTVAHAAPGVVAHPAHAVVPHTAPTVVQSVAPSLAVAPVVSHGVGHATVHAAPSVVSHGVSHVSHGVSLVSHGHGGHATVQAAAPAAVVVHTPVAQTAALAVHHHHTPAVVAHATPLVAHATPTVAHVAHATPVVAHATPVVAHVAPVVAATTHHHVPVTHTTHAVTYGAGGSADSEVYPDEIIPYSYEYTVSDPETNNNFNAVESDDGTGVRSGSYSVSLPDSRIQHVTYTTDANGYVATVTYEGTAVYPDIV